MSGSFKNFAWPDWLLAYCLAVAVTGCSAPAAPSTPAGSDAQATPQATFDTMKQAFATADAARLQECFTDEGLNELAGTLSMFGGFISAVGNNPKADPKMAAAAKQLKSVLSKHVAAGGPEVNLDFSAPEEKIRAQVRQLGQRVTDRPAFVAEFVGVLMQDEFKQPNAPSLKDLAVVDVKIDGEMATATFNQGLAGGGPSPVTFRRVDGKWKIDQMGKWGVTDSDTPRPAGIPGGPQPSDPPAK